MSESIRPVPVKEDDFSLKDLIHKGIEYFWLLWGGKWWIILCAILGAGVFFLKAYLEPVTYPAKLTFSLNEGDNGGISALSGLLGQIGLGGGGTSSGKVSLDKIVELSKSMRIVNKALFEKVTIDGKTDYIINHLIGLYEFDKKLSKYNPFYKNFRFTSDSLGSFSLEENAALKSIYWFIIGGIKPGLVTCMYDTKSTIFSLTATTVNPELSLALSENIFDKLAKFYIQQSSDKQKQTFDLVRAKADSLYRKWTGSEYSSSSMDQRENGLWNPLDRTKKTIQSKQSNMYALAYAESLKNLEIADYALKNSTPFIREIDRPFAPLDAISPNIIIEIIKGLIIGLAISAIFIIGKNIISQALKS